jgi:hypothetical protein
MSKTWPSGPKQKVIEKLEQELQEKPCEMLAAHILQLKKAWGFICMVPEKQAA